MDDVRPVFNQLNIVSGDPAASIEFYRRLGVAIPASRVWPSEAEPHHVSAGEAGNGEAPQLDLDSVAFAKLWNTGWRSSDDLRGRVVIGFGVKQRDAVDRLHAHMKAAGYRSLQEPYDTFWGARYAVMEDPDGLAVGIMSDISDERRSLPPRV
jgi:uncharacterized glyoxalase superfamily protein PhnB